MAPRNSKQFEEIRQASVRKITAAALELFAGNGYQNVSVSQIAMKAGVSKGLMYNYFESKQALLLHVLENMILEMGEVMENRGVEPPLQQAEKMIRHTFEHLKSKKEFWASVIPVLTQHGVDNRIIAEKLRPFFAGFIEAMEALFSQAGLSNARLEAYKLGALIDGIALDYLYIFTEDYPLDELEQFIIDQYQVLKKKTN